VIVRYIKFSICISGDDMKNLLIAGLLLSTALALQANAESIITPSGDVHYITPGAGGYTDVNASTNESTIYMQSNHLTTVIPQNGLGEPQNYMTDGTQKLLIIEPTAE
jgi:hypothetical protein